jgi:hypothetical protein
MPVAIILIIMHYEIELLAFLMIMPDIIKSSWPRKMRLKRLLYIHASLVYLNGLS